MYMESFNWIIGKTFTEVKQVNNYGDELHFVSDEGTFVFYHDQNCCESVGIEEVHGDLNDLVGAPLLVAEERTETGETADAWADSQTWTFYEFRTIKGSVTVRWLGTSNGYYSERVDYKLLDK